jgi:hypothetical protein
MKRPNFSGHCRPCNIKKGREGHIRWMYREKSGQPRVVRNGYVALPATLIADEDLPLFRTMQGKGGYVLQHRWNMAKALGRPLKRSECVDHIDGNKQNNDVANLRLYRMGSGEPGDTPGHGTYYHEWQMAEKRNRDLQAKLDQTLPNTCVTRGSRLITVVR